MRKTRLSLGDLYDANAGEYHFTNGWHMPAVIATVSGTALALAGQFIQALRPMYDYSWFVGFGVAGVMYWVMTRGGTAKSYCEIEGDSRIDMIHMFKN